MRSKKSTTRRTTEAGELRRLAEAKLSRLKKKTAPLRNADAEYLRQVHELEVHQIELEMQKDELAQSRTEVEAARDRYADLYDFAPVGYFTLTGEGGIQKANLMGAKLLGGERSKLIGRHFGRFVALESRPVFNTFLKNVFSTDGIPVTCDLVLQRNGSDPVWIHLEAALDRGQAICRTVVVDITEHKQAEEELRGSERRFRETLENVDLVAVVLDLEGHILFCNNYLLQLTGYTLEETLGRDWFAQFIPETHPDIKEIFVKEIQQGNIRAHYENPIRTKSGEERIILFNNTILRNAQGGITGTTSIGEDITDRKKTEAELRLSRDRLADLSRRLVATHEEEARAIGRELHDQIGQMLTALKLTLAIPAQMVVAGAADKLAAAHTLVEDLLTRVSALSLELRPPMLDDLGLIPALLWYVYRFQEQSGVHVEFKHHGAEGRRFDPNIETTVYRIIQETLTNVARHAQAATVRLELKAGDEGMEIHIEDDGGGFDTQAALEKNRGLSGIRERALLVGGTFEVESQVGRGTKEYIRFPLGGKTG